MKKVTIVLIFAILLALAGNTLASVTVFNNTTGFTGWNFVSGGNALSTNTGYTQWELVAGLVPLVSPSGSNAGMLTAPATGPAIVYPYTGSYVGIHYQAPAGQMITSINIPRTYFSADTDMKVQITDGAGVVKSQSIRAASDEMLTNLSAYGLNASAVEIRFINVSGGMWDAPLWAGNYVAFKSVEVTTETIAPDCGNIYHPKPLGDFNNDCAVDFADMALLGSNWLSIGAPPFTGNLNSDSIVNFDDFTLLAAHWMENSMLNQQPSLSLFGYYFIASDYFGNYIADVAGFTNFNFMDWSSTYAQQAGTYNEKMVVNLRWVFFSGPGLRSDYVSVWNYYASMMAPYINNIGAFYVMDEPYWNGISKADVETAAKLCKDTFPQIPTMIVEGYPVLDGSTNRDFNGNYMPPFQMPSYIDYFGFDQYSNFPAIVNLLQITHNHLLPGQKIVLVPQDYSESGSTDAQTASWAYDFYNLALSDPCIIGMEVFLWPSNAGLPLSGPLTRAAYKDIGAQIVSGAKPKIYFPDSYAVNQGAYSSGSATSLKNYDNSYLTVNSVTSGATRYATTDFNVAGISIASPSKIKVRTNTRTASGNITQTVQLWNYSTSAWDSKDTTTAVANSTTRDISLTADTSSYINNGILKIRIASSASVNFNILHDQIAVLVYK